MLLSLAYASSSDTWIEVSNTANNVYSASTAVKHKYTLYSSYTVTITDSKRTLTLYPAYFGGGYFNKEATIYNVIYTSATNVTVRQSGYSCTFINK